MHRFLHYRDGIRGLPWHNSPCGNDDYEKLHESTFKCFEIPLLAPPGNLIVYDDSKIQHGERHGGESDSIQNFRYRFFNSSEGVNNVTHCKMQQVQCKDTEQNG